MSTSILINLLFQADDGLIQYPYSTREVVNIVKHLERFPDEGLGAVVRDVAYSHSYDNNISWDKISFCDYNNKGTLLDLEF